MGVYHFHSNVTAAHPFQSNRFHSCIFPILAYLFMFTAFNINQAISDLKDGGW